MTTLYGPKNTMATTGRWLGLGVLAAAILGVLMSGCGKIRDLPVDKPITLLNGNMQETKQFDMLDTLYVQLAGLSVNQMYTVQALDPSGQLISTLSLLADENGVIPPAALWYDVGLRKTAAGATTSQPDTGGTLSVQAFNIHVTGNDGTDYTEPFYIVYSNNNVGQQPRPVVWATSSATRDAGFENAFEESGTTDNLGAAGKTKVYLEARHLPAAVNGAATTAVDVYILPAKGAGDVWNDGDTLGDKYVILQLGVAVADDGSGAKEFANPVLIWDLDNPLTPLINPTENNNSYDIVVDVNRNGVFDLGDDLNGDGVTDHYVDGIDGQGVIGFIVTNTPANDFFATVTDASGAQSDTLPDGQSNSDQLALTLDNLPFGAAPVIHLYQHLTTTDAVPPINLTVQPANGTTHLLDYVNATLFVDTTSALAVQYPTGVTTPATVAYDLTVTGIGATNYTKTIKVVHPATALIPTNGTVDTQVFDETGTGGGNTKVYVRTVTSGLTGGATATVYVVPHATAWNNGDRLSPFTTQTATTVPLAGDLNQLLVWDLDASPQLVNPTAANNGYDLVVDADNNGIYTAGVDLLASLGFSVRDTTANSIANLIFANIASGGVFNYVWWDHWTWSNNPRDFDYRDSFHANGLDTKYAYGGAGTPSGYGIKAVWNPYLRSNWSVVPANTPSIYDGQWVDVYIVNAATADLSANAALGSGGNADVAGGKKTMPVQRSCWNGACQQNIWSPNFTVGSYFVIVDINRDGLLTEGVDMVDAVRQDGTTIAQDPSVVGFSVVP